MSRLGKMPIDLPDKVEVKLNGDVVTVKGGRGSLERQLPPTTTVEVEDKQLKVTTDGSHPNSKAFHGLARSLVQNMVTGVSTGWTKELLLVGIGYRAQVKGKTLVLSLGYSHPVEMPIPEGIEVEVGGKKQEELKITGSNREQLGEWVANIRSKRKPEPYKGKGVRYKDEQVKLKAGKRVGA